MRHAPLKFLLASAASLALAGMIGTASADERPQAKAPTKTMGDEGKLPATKSMGAGVHDMRGPQSAETPSAAEGGSSGTSGKGPTKRMGDEGKLPATGTMGNAVPDMTTQHGSSK